MRKKHFVLARGNSWTATLCGITLQGYGLGQTTKTVDSNTCKKCVKLYKPVKEE